MSTHARLSPSGAKRWINCPASPRLIAAAPVPPSSPAAREGTAAHALAAECLTNGEYDALSYEGESFDDAPEFPVTKKMAGAVNVYLSHVYALGAGSNGFEFYVERHLSLAHIHKDMAGTADALVYNAATATLSVCDYKHGRGVDVDGDDNPQAKMYALGALAFLRKEGHKPRTVNTYIIQPRNGGPPVKPATFSTVDLAEFAEELREAGARCDDPNAKPVAGPWCHDSFCSAAATCPAIIDTVKADFEAANIATAMLKEGQPQDARQIGGMITDSRDALKRAKLWNDAVEELAMAEALAGRMPEGFKAVAGVGRRQWADIGRDAESFIDALQGLTRAPKAALMSVEPLSPAQIEKVLNKQQFEAVKHLIAIKQGAPKLVPLSAKGEAVSLVDTAGFEAVK